MKINTHTCAQRVGFNKMSSGENEKSIKMACLVVHKVLTASNFNCEIACLSSFIHVNQRWDIRARARARARRRVNYQRGFVRTPRYGKFENFVALKFHRLVLAGGAGNAREPGSGIADKYTLAIYSLRFVLAAHRMPSDRN